MAQGVMTRHLTAKQQNDKYGSLLAEPPFSAAQSPFLLHKALTSRQSPIPVSQGTVKEWWKAHKVLASMRFVFSQLKPHAADPTNKDFGPCLAAQCLLELVMALLVVCSRSSVVPGCGVLTTLGGIAGYGESRGLFGPSIPPTKWGKNPSPR